MRRSALAETYASDGHRLFPLAWGQGHGHQSRVTRDAGNLRRANGLVRTHPWTSDASRTTAAAHVAKATMKSGGPAVNRGCVRLSCRKVANTRMAAQAGTRHGTSACTRSSRRSPAVISSPSRVCAVERKRKHVFATACALTAVRNGQRRRLSAQRIFKLPNKQLKLSNRRYVGPALKRLQRRVRRRHVSCSSLLPNHC